MDCEGEIFWAELREYQRSYNLVMDGSLTAFPFVFTRFLLHFHLEKETKKKMRLEKDKELKEAKEKIESKSKKQAEESNKQIQALQKRVTNSMYCAADITTHARCVFVPCLRLKYQLHS